MMKKILILVLIVVSFITGGCNKKEDKVSSLIGDWKYDSYQMTIKLNDNWVDINTLAKTNPQILIFKALIDAQIKSSAPTVVFSESEVTYNMMGETSTFKYHTKNWVVYDENDVPMFSYSYNGAMLVLILTQEMTGIDDLESISAVLGGTVSDITMKLNLKK